MQSLSKEIINEKNEKKRKKKKEKKEIDKSIIYNSFSFLFLRFPFSNYFMRLFLFFAFFIACLAFCQLNCPSLSNDS